MKLEVNYLKLISNLMLYILSHFFLKTKFRQRFSAWFERQCKRLCYGTEKKTAIIRFSIFHCLC